MNALIEFVVEGRPYTIRRWQHVPRVGEVVTFAADIFQVRQVIWCDHDDPVDTFTCKAQVHMVRAPI